MRVVGISVAVVLLFAWHIRRTWDWFDDDSGRPEA
jgi:hypothetical protein